MKETDIILNEAIKKLNKKYDNNVIAKVGEMEYATLKTFSTGCYSLDRVFACGGLPIGRIIEIYGEPSSGKTAMALFILGQVQKQGGKCMFIDAEFSFDNGFSEKLGVNTKELLFSQPNTGEEAINTIEEIAKTKQVDVIVVDSVSSLVPEAELEGGIDKNSIALQARMLSKGLRILTGLLAKSETTVIFINQTRMRTGVYFGNPNTTSGGKSLKFYSSVRLEIKGKKIKGKEDEVVGNILSITATKNKTGIPFRKTEISLYFERGIDVTGDLFDVSIQQGIITKAGMTYSIGETKLGAGRDNAKEYIEKHPEILKEIKSKLK